MTSPHNERRGERMRLVVALVAVCALACGAKKSTDASSDSAGAPGGRTGSSDAAAGASGAGGGGAAGGGDRGGTAGAGDRGGTAGGTTTSGPDAGQNDDGGVDAHPSHDSGLDASATFTCSPNPPDGGWDWDGSPPPSAACVRGQQFCDNAKCRDLQSVQCAQQPTCLCVDRGYINCHCSEDGAGAVWHLGCDPI